MKIIKVSYECIKCGIECTTTNHNMRYRDHHKNEPICQKCLIKLEKSSIVFDAIPDEFHNQIFAGLIDYRVASRYLCGVSTKLRVKFECRECSDVHIIRWSDLARRRHHRHDNICVKCLNNLIQNDPKKIEENRNRSKSLWQDNSDYRLQCLKAFELHNTKMQADPEYANKHHRRSKSITGKVLIGDRYIIFDSAFELIFLWHIKDKYATIRRCSFAIAYGGHFYHPDFFVVDDAGHRTIIEVKGYYNNNVVAKQRAAKQYIEDTGTADSYTLYNTERMISESILLGVGGAVMWKQIREIYNEATIAFTDPKHQRIAEIGLSRFRTEIKNQKDNKKALHR